MLDTRHIFSKTRKQKREHETNNKNSLPVTGLTQCRPPVGGRGEISVPKEMAVSFMAFGMTVVQAFTKTTSLPISPHWQPEIENW